MNHHRSTECRRRRRGVLLPWIVTVAACCHRPNNELGGVEAWSPVVVHPTTIYTRDRKRHSISPILFSSPRASADHEKIPPTKTLSKNKNGKSRNKKRGGSNKNKNRGHNKSKQTHKKGNNRKASGSKTNTKHAETVSELVQNVRSILGKNYGNSISTNKDWRTAWSILKSEATIPKPTEKDNLEDNKDHHTTVLPVRIYHEILECMKNEPKCWQDAIRLVLYMERGNPNAATSIDNNKSNNKKNNKEMEKEIKTELELEILGVDKYNSRPWHIPSPNYEVYHTLLECISKNGSGRKDAHDALVYWLSKMLRKLEGDLTQQFEYKKAVLLGKTKNDDDNDNDTSGSGVSITNRDRKLIRNSIQLVLSSLSKQRKWREALQLLDYAEILSKPDRANLPLTVVQYNTVLTSLARCKQVGQCQRLLQRLQAKNSLNNNNQSDDASRIVRPDEISYNSVISACASSGKWREALEVLDECYQEPGVEPNIYIYTNAMRACAKAGNTQKALDLLEVVKDKGLPVDSYCYTAVIDACAKGKQWKKALELFDEMESKGIEPTQVTYSVTISALGNGLQWERALWLLNVMRDKGMKVNLITYNAAITALAKSSKNKHSAKLSSSSSTGATSEGNYSDDDDDEDEELWSKALELLEQMEEDGIEPDGFCYSSAINCCGAEGRWEEACQLIDVMKSGGPKSRPNKIAYTAAISACGRAGQSSKALELFQNMRDDGLAADRVAYNALFSALRVSEDADRAYELWGEICGRKTTAATAKGAIMASPDIITLTDCIATLSRAGYTSKMDEVFSEAVDRGIVLGGSNGLDVEQWEIDLSGLPFPIARAATRYLLQSVMLKQEQKEENDDENDGNRHNNLQDMIFITGIGKAQQKRKEASSSSYFQGAANGGASSNVLERKDRTTSLRDFIQGILNTDFNPPIQSSVPELAQGTVVIEEATLTKWLQDGSVVT